MLYIVHVLVIFTVPIIFTGLINRTKAIWAGRKGFPILQLFYDLVRLIQKIPVYSKSTSWVFQASGVVFLATTMVASALSPIFPGFSLISFQYDFVALAYLFALGRIAIILGALDTASSFEGMGASREATYSALIEPVLFISLGTLSLLAKSNLLSGIVSVGGGLPNNLSVVVLCVVALFILLQIETSRVPADDPNTHLELTMIHEVMILDHSGFDLAAIQYASAIKMTVLAGLIAALLNPFLATENAWASVGVSLGIMGILAVSIGLIESVMARIRLKTIPRFIFISFSASVLAMLCLLLEDWWLK